MLGECTILCFRFALWYFRLTMLYCKALWNTGVLVPSNPTPSVSSIILLLLRATVSVRSAALRLEMAAPKLSVTLCETNGKLHYTGAVNSASSTIGHHPNTTHSWCHQNNTHRNQQHSTGSLSSWLAWPHVIFSVPGNSQLCALFSLKTPTN